MLYLRCALTGIVAALLACVIYVLAVFVLPVVLPFALSRFGDSGAGMASASISSGPAVAILMVAFVAGFYWRLRRHRA